MSKQKTYYKVLRPNNASSYASNQYCIYYAPNVTVTAKHNLPIFIFDTLENARSYAKNNLYDYVIYECIAKRVRKPYKKIFDHDSLFCEYWKIVNKAKQQKKSIIKALHKYRTIEPITGTLWANSITLTKQIQ